MYFDQVASSLPHIQAGKLQALALMSPERSPVLPQVPTMAESGVQQVELSAWVGLFAPAKTPQPVIDRLQRAAHAALAGDTVARLQASGMEPAPGTGQQLKDSIASEIRVHSELVKAAGLVPQ